MLGKIIKQGARKLGYNIVKSGGVGVPVDMEKEFIEIYNRCSSYTMTSIERMYALYKGVEYICQNNIKGDFVECGVWRGGSSMVMALSLMKFNNVENKIFLYDTFEGMSEPTGKDIDLHGKSADELLAQHSKTNDINSVWCYETLDEVKKNLESTGYPKENLVFVKGKVENTIPETIPAQISLLRLDTDWYESTSHEMKQLYPLLEASGVLIIDDYGHWSGSRKAVDEYFSQSDQQILLNRIDYTGRIGIKL